MSESAPVGMVRLAPGDARRGGLLWLLDPAGDPGPPEVFAEQGYEVLAAPESLTDDELQQIVARLRPPVFLRAAGERGWRAACVLAGLSAASVFGPLSGAGASPGPSCPTIVHLSGAEARPAEVAALEASGPQVAVWIYDGGIQGGDGARLSQLRTLQLFARQAGRGEV